MNGIIVKYVIFNRDFIRGISHHPETGHWGYSRNNNNNNNELLYV